MRWLRRLIVVFGALALVAASTGNGGGERIPQAARALEVTVKRPHRPAISDVSVTNDARIGRIASLINGLKTQRPGVLDCTGRADDPVMTLTFRAAPGGRILARATQIIEPITRGGYCEPMTLTIKGHVSSPLLGGVKVVRAAERLFGAKVPRS